MTKQRTSLSQLNDSIYEVPSNILESAEIHRQHHIDRANSVFEELLRRQPDNAALLIEMWESLSSAEDVREAAVIEHCFNEGIDKVFTR